MNVFESIKRERAIGIGGTIVRVVVGLLFLYPLLVGRFEWNELLLGLVGFPLILLFWQRLRLRRTSAQLQATGLIGFIVNVAVFLALYLTPVYFPPLSVTSDAALIFYGASMLLAALRGYAGCEVLAVSNWLLRRDDQVGCVFFSPVDALEKRLSGAQPQ